MQSKGILVELMHEDSAKRFLEDHLDEDPAALALKYASRETSFELAPILELISIYSKARNKLPSFFLGRCILNRKAYEQCSSEITALWKADRYTGTTLLNLCGGIGVDDWAFADRFSEVVSLEADPEIHELAQYNLKHLGKKVNRICITAEEFLFRSTDNWDLIYADPDRRTEGERVFGLSDSSPSIPDLWETMLNRARRVLIKASPMINITSTLRELKRINRVTVLAVDNEVKEVLLEASAHTAEELLFEAVNVGREGEQCFSGTPQQLIAQGIPDKAAWFYECNLALIKAGLCGAYARQAGTLPLTDNAAFQVSLEDIPDFFGRRFRIVHIMDYSKNNFNRYLKEQKIVKANISRREFRLSPEQLKTLHKLRDGGDEYFFFFVDVYNESRVIHARKA